MKTIDRLLPVGVLDVRVLVRLIAHVLGVIEVQLAQSVSGVSYSTRKVLKLSRLVARLSRQHRDNVNYNLNLKIKIWVLAAPARVLWVRCIIGEASIRRWQKHYDAALGEKCLKPVLGEVQLGKLENSPKSGTKISDPPPHATKSYTWRRYVLGDVYMLCQRPPQLNLPSKPMQDLKQSLEHSLEQTLGGWLQPREKRILKPVVFWPHELAPGYKPGAEFRYCKENLNVNAAASQCKRGKRGRLDPDPPYGNIGKKIRKHIGNCTGHSHAKPP